MRVLLHVPLPRGSTRGNWITAIRWSKLLHGLGHTVRTVDPSEYASTETSSYDVFIALHARRSAEAIQKFRIATPQGKIVVALTGTDLHVDLFDGTAGFSCVTKSMRVADRIVLLEPEGLNNLAPEFRQKCTVIFQSTLLPRLEQQTRGSRFRIAFLAHLREVKNPFLICRAVELLPPSSSAMVTHAGEATSVFWRDRALQWSESCSRYEWVRAISHQDAMQLLANSQLTVLTSRHEGAPSVFSEAAALGVPILSTRIPASVGILGAKHPGLFNVDDAAGLAKLIHRAEHDQDFYEDLCSATDGIGASLSPQAEVRSWRELLAGLQPH